MQQRQPHTHMTCGFCLQPKIIRSKPHETKSGQPICEDCLKEYNRCFPPLTEVNNLPTVEPVASFFFTWRGTPNENRNQKPFFA